MLQGPLKLTNAARHGHLEQGPEQPMDIENREELIYTLGKASELEHLIICQYLYAVFSLKRFPSEGIDSELKPVVDGWAHNLMAIGSRVYMAHYTDGVRVIDIANPASPTMLGYFNTWVIGTGTCGDLGTFGIDLDPVRKRIYAADSVRGLVILQGDSTVFP